MVVWWVVVVVVVPHLAWEWLGSSTRSLWPPPATTSAPTMVRLWPWDTGVSIALTIYCTLHLTLTWCWRSRGRMTALARRK